MVKWPPTRGWSSVTTWIIWLPLHPWKWPGKGVRPSNRRSRFVFCGFFRWMLVSWCGKKMWVRDFKVSGYYDLFPQMMFVFPSKKSRLMYQSTNQHWKQRRLSCCKRLSLGGTMPFLYRQMDGAGASSVSADREHVMLVKAIGCHQWQTENERKQLV